MFKSIFSKLLVIFLSIMIFSFSIAGVMLFHLLSDYASIEKENLLNQSADKINNFLNVYIQNQGSAVAEWALRQILEMHRVNTNSIIMIADTEGNIVVTEPDFTKNSDVAELIRSNLKLESGHYRFPDERQYKRVMTGQEPAIKEIGDFYGFFSSTRVSWLTIEKPFIEDGVVKGAVYLHTAIPEVQRARSSVFRFFMNSMMIAVLVSAVLVYIFSRRLTKPLKEIKNAAKEISSGDFHKRLSITSQDEIGDLAKSFNNMVTALENLEEMRRGFIANVSHELRTPMTSIRGFIEGILDGTIPPERQNNYLMIVRDEVNRLNRLVNDLLDLAKMEAGEMKLNFKDFNINELLRRCIIKLEGLIVEKDLQVEADFEEENMYVNADADAIERVLINLIHNAIKFSPEKGRINISTVRHKDRVLVTVQDSGIGIDQNEIDLIWDRFYKSDKSRGKDKTGTGLGLAIVKNIINEHGQEISVESELEKGTTFRFTLNRSREH